MSFATQQPIKEGGEEEVRGGARRAAFFSLGRGLGLLMQPLERGSPPTA